MKDMIVLDTEKEYAQALVDLLEITEKVPGGRVSSVAYDMDRADVNFDDGRGLVLNGYWAQELKKRSGIV